MSRAYLCTILLALSASACLSDGEAQPGEEGGPCRISLQPCEEGLVCRDNGCRDPIESDGGVPTLDVRFELNKRALRANGQDALVARFYVVDRETKKPWMGTVRIWTYPTGGVVNPASFELGEDGRGVLQFTACDGEKPGCPARTRLRVATVDRPLESIGESDDIMLIGGGASPADGGVEPTPTTDAGMPERPTPTQCRGDETRMELVGRGESWALSGEVVVVPASDVRFTHAVNMDGGRLQFRGGGASVTVTAADVAALMAGQYDLDGGPFEVAVEAAGKRCTTPAGRINIRAFEADAQGTPTQVHMELSVTCEAEFQVPGAVEGCVKYVP